MLLPAATCLLFAAGFDWLEAVLPFLFVAFWIVSQVFAVFRRLQGGGQRPPPLPRFDRDRDPQPLPRPPADDAAIPRTDLEKQIAEFLREATGQEPRQPTGKKAPTKPDTRPQPMRPVPRADTERRVPQVTRAQGPRQAAPARREPKKPAVTVPEAGATTQERLDTNASVARHVKDAFARELTHLQGTIKQDELTAGGGAPKAVTQAEELVHLLRSPATIRQVILLREVLDRPVDRW
jgi:hypothetical protein